MCPMSFQVPLTNGAFVSVTALFSVLNENLRVMWRTTQPFLSCSNDSSGACKLA